MSSQSARATTAAESRYRIAEPNSRRRSSLVVALDEASLGLLAELASGDWNGARFRGVRLAASDDETGPRDVDDLIYLQSPAGEVSRLADELEATDVVVMIAHSGAPAEGAAPIGRASFSRHIMTTGFVLDTSGERTRLGRTLRQMRPYVASLVVGSDEDALRDVLNALRA